MSEYFSMEKNRDFNKNLFRDVLSELASVPEDKISFGPRYFIATPVGKMQVDTIATFSNWNVTGPDDCFSEEEYEEKISTEPDEANRYEQHCYLVASVPGTGVVGYRRCELGYERVSHFSKDKNPKKIDAKNARIEINKKGQGIGTLLELIFCDYLQRMANQRHIQIRWNVFNANLQNLNLFRSQILDERFRDHYYKQRKMSEFDRDQSVDDDERIKPLIEEQKRWMALYGNDGKLGVTMEDETGGYKDFNPENNTAALIDFRSLASIYMTRTDTKEGVTGKIEKVVKKENEQRFNEEQLAVLHRLKINSVG
jgi:hypothetical protein